MCVQRGLIRLSMEICRLKIGKSDHFHVTLIGLSENAFLNHIHSKMFELLERRTEIKLLLPK